MLRRGFPKAAIVLIGIAVVLGALRVSGNTSEVFQATAHIYVGGLFAIGYWGGPPHATTEVALVVAFALTILETICFVASHLS